MSDYVSSTSFADLPISDELRLGIGDRGYTTPTPVQAAVFGPILAGRDVICRSKTGTGKTAAFGIPLLERIPGGTRRASALVLCNTRELALQVSQELESLARHKNISVIAVYGGAPMGVQTQALQAGAEVIVGTPGRVYDHIRRGTLKLDDTRIAVLDEADEMLSAGFFEEVTRILDHLPPDRQTLLFSATVPPDIEQLAAKYLRNPETIQAHRWEPRLHPFGCGRSVPSGATRFEGKLSPSSARWKVESPHARGYVGREVATGWPRAARASVPLPQGPQRAPQPRQAGPVGAALGAVVPQPARPPLHPAPRAQRKRRRGGRLRPQGGQADVHPSPATAVADRRMAGGRLGGPGRRRAARGSEGERGHRAHSLRLGAPPRGGLRALARPAPGLGRHRAARARGHEDLRAALRAVRTDRARGREHRAGAGRRNPELEAAGGQHLPSHPAPAHPARLQPQRPRVHPHRDRPGGGAVLGAVPLHAGHRAQGAGALPRGAGSRRSPSPRRQRDARVLPALRRAAVAARAVRRRGAGEGGRGPEDRPRAGAVPPHPHPRLRHRDRGDARRSGRSRGPSAGAAEDRRPGPASGGGREGRDLRARG